METYQVKKLDDTSNLTVTVPGSKSITNRALLLAAMTDGSTTLDGVLFSDDSRVFLQALKDLGFSVEIEERNKVVTIDGKGGTIPNKKAEIYVGSAGTAARFLTAFVAMEDGEYTLTSSEQMKKRPMRELFEALESLGAKIEYLEEEGHFPVRMKGIPSEKNVDKKDCFEIPLNIDRSSQFLSALLMVAPIRLNSLSIRMTGTRNARSYVEMTEQMMKQFSHPGVERLDQDSYKVSKASYQSGGVYHVEPDVSGACYFYAIAAITGKTTMVKNVRRDSLQGDMQFLKVLEKMGCQLEWKEDDLYLTGPKKGELKGITVDLSDCSDQTLTLAAIAPFANSPVTVNGIAHIRGQECDRIHAISENMTRMGIRCEEREDGFTIYPGMPKPASIDTYNDHRVAMSFALTGLLAEGIVIENPKCCRKTFESYFTLLDQVVSGKDIIVDCN